MDSGVLEFRVMYGFGVYGSFACLIFSLRALCFIGWSERFGEL